MAMEMSVKLKKLKRIRRKRKWNIERLKRNSIPFQKSVEEAIWNNSGMNVNERWGKFKEVVLRSA